MCRFYIRTASLKLPIKGCSFQCYREVEVKSCCPGFWGPDCAGGFLLGGWGWGGGLLGSLGSHEQCWLQDAGTRTSFLCWFCVSRTQTC